MRTASPTFIMLLAAITVLPITAFDESPAEKFNRIPAGILRTFATESPIPPFPPECIAAGHHGLVSVQIFVKGDGSISHVSVLQAPDSQIADSVISTLSHWKFRPATFKNEAEPWPVYSTLIYYFNFENGQPVVIDTSALHIYKGKAQ